MKRPRGSKLWWWVVVAFIVQLTAWAVWFSIAANHPVAEVPLATRPVAP
jgi:hypothetical protein